MNWNLLGGIYGTSSIKIAHFVLIRLQTWPPQAIFFSNCRFLKIFSSETAWQNEQQFGRKHLFFWHSRIVYVYVPTYFIRFYTFMVYFSMYIYWIHINILKSPLVTLSSSSVTINELLLFFYSFIFQYFVYVLIYRIYNVVHSEMVLMSNIKY